ncbi:incFII family plasmid replication initiator RepA [Salmonella enterica subsp. enterica serovar Oranienburg]|uniref:incFII family plasmid replication initiator RepA n=1 Tax=Salmonella enterica TaxID=28901 RepID=UPI0009B13EDA|nr:incFII family plasmid replication initiator RepA [Salmonella enterica]EEN5143120.1 incFII family plasmid replication initiator RepA [Salmonella enterica subsp. enterica serovar Oranienburg]EEX0088005.1 incFII family plasmid replication initiator RepA [Salmonella enterica]EID1118171.1 incFII family plasmid replication initiator RepA [Salmonella enterica]QVB78674.1 incFII family plasmid replication initiator RepA [Salmonella enterica subsp. enterica serovar Rubislaw]
MREGVTDTQTLFSHYRQVRNPNPEFTPREGKKTLPFCRKLMAKAEGFTSRFDFSVHVAFVRSLGKRHRMPPVLRRRAIDALLQGLCFHYDPLANRVQRSITNLAIECGLATESKSGNLSITRATRALKFMSELGLITYQTEYDPQIGCNIPTDITFTPALFSALDVSDVAVAAARRSRVEWENKQRQKQNLKLLEMDELIAKAWRFVRERFRSYQSERKLHGLKRARARRDAGRTRKDIETLVKQQLTREYASGLDAMKRELQRRVKERMMMSRGNNYTRLTTVPI